NLFVRVGGEGHAHVIDRLAVELDRPLDVGQRRAGLAAAEGEDHAEGNRRQRRTQVGVHRGTRCPRQGTVMTNPSARMASRWSVTRSVALARKRTEPSARQKLAPPACWLPKTLIRKS